MRTTSKIVKGTSLTYGLILRLAGLSQWFQYEPLPDDHYEITVKEEIKHLLDGTAEVAVVQQLATYDDNNGCFTDNVPLLDAHIVANEEQVVIDLAKPNVRWQDGPRLYLERRMDQWCCFIHRDSDDVIAIVRINDNGTIDLK